MIPKRNTTSLLKSIRARYKKFGIDYTLKKQRLKIAQLGKVRFIKVNELKLTEVESF